jgi:hypothetical protein
MERLAVEASSDSEVARPDQLTQPFSHCTPWVAGDVGVS